MVAFGVYLAFTGVAETRGMPALVFPKYILTSEFTEFLGRGRGPFLNPVTNGIFMAVCICCTLMWWPRTTGIRGPVDNFDTDNGDLPLAYFQLSLGVLGCR